MSDPRLTDLTAVAALDEPTRRRLYDLVAASPEPLSRDDAAAALDLPRTTAAFHLERLADEDLLEVTYARRSGRSGPGAGRPTKLYRRSRRQVSVSIPARRYDLAGRLLAAAVEDAGRTGRPARELLDERARRLGAELGRAARAAPDGLTADLIRMLRDYGFEPHADGTDITLGNCPFHALAADFPTTVCGMNLHLLEGLLSGLENTEWTARLDPAPDRCCVRLER